MPELGRKSPREESETTGICGGQETRSPYRIYFGDKRTLKFTGADL